MKYRQNADILIMQETHSTVDCEKIWEKEWGGKAIFSHGTELARGVAVFMSNVLYQKIDNVYKDTDGRLIMFDLCHNDQVVTLVAIYAPNQDCPKFFMDIGTMLRTRQENKVIIGDFNLVMDNDKDRLNTYNNNNKAKDEVENIIEEYSLKDVWRIQNENDRQFSWSKKGRSDERKASRIDFALVSAGLDHSVKTSTYITGIKTDHRAFYVVLDLNKFERGSGFWKMNVKYLKEIEFIDQMKSEIEKTINSAQNKKPSDKWELVKSRCKECAIQYSRHRATKDSIIVAQLSEKVNEYESNFPLNENNEQLYQETKIELEDKLIEKAKGAMFRSKVKWYEEGEKNTRYFYTLEKTKYNAKTCYKVIDEEGEEVEDPKQILKVQRKFYLELYEEDRNVHFDLIT